MNILTNAIDAISQKTANACAHQPDLGKITIATTALSNQKDRDWVQIAIFDNGCGIAPQDRDKIFDPFFTTKPVGSGKGLGLAIAYQIVVQAHQGRLWFETSASAGTTFFIELPLLQPDISQGNSVLRT